MTTPSPALTELPLAGAAARGRNGWFDARSATIFGTDELISGNAGGYQPPRSPGGNRLPDPGVTIAIRSKRLGRNDPIWFQLTRTDAIAFASAILAHTNTAPTVLATHSTSAPSANHRVRISLPPELLMDTPTKHRAVVSIDFVAADGLDPSMVADTIVRDLIGSGLDATLEDVLDLEQTTSQPTRRARVVATGQIVDVTDYGPTFCPRWWDADRGYMDDELELADPQPPEFPQ